MRPLVLLFSILGLNYALLAQQTILDTITVDGIERSYILYVPDSYDSTQECALIINMHGRSRTASNQMSYGDFRPIADTAGFIIVHPQGTKDAQNRDHWNFNRSTNTVDDVHFISDLITKLSSSYSIDSSRLFATGFSQGGFMSYYLACNLPDKLAGIGIVGGGMVDSVNCYQAFPIPIVHIHGTSDGQVPYDTYNISFLMSYCASNNGCKLVPNSRSLQNKSVADGSTVTLYEYIDGIEGTMVTHYKVNNGGHTWPGTAGDLPGTNYDIDASLEIWNFFNQFTTEGKIGYTSVDEIELGSYTLYPNPAGNQIRVKRVTKESVLYGILDIYGKVQLEGELVGSEILIDVSSLLPGLYYLKTPKGSLPFVKIKD